MLNEDYKDMLRALVGENARFLLVGAYAMATHGYPRATMDIDIWVMPSAENAQAVLRALRQFGAPVHQLSAADLQQTDTIFQIGVAPRRIDIITGVDGLEFEATFGRSVQVDVEGIALRVPNMADLIRNKRASARLKDLADVEALESLVASRQREQDDG